VKMFIDLVLVIGSALVVVDLKSGAKTPASLSQLGIYASGIELAYGREHRPRYGSWFMLRGTGKVGATDEEKTYFQTPVELTGYQHSVKWWTGQFTVFDKAVKAGTFLAREGEHCKRCGVSYACPAVGGAQASRFDPTLKGAIA
jgi:hypothetical protein